MLQAFCGFKVSQYSDTLRLHIPGTDLDLFGATSLVSNMADAVPGPFPEAHDGKEDDPALPAVGGTDGFGLNILLHRDDDAKFVSQKPSITTSSTLSMCNCVVCGILTSLKPTKTMS